jgi:hypothetical protein
MTSPVSLNDDSAPLFDVVVRTPSGARLEDIERKAIAAGVAADRVASLIKVLRSRPDAKIGAGVTRERADRAKEQFTQAGLTVEVTPLMVLQSLMTGAFDGLAECPACNARVTLTTDRQCPKCGVYVDKVTDEFLLKRKLMEQERSKIASQAMRDQKNMEDRIRKTLEDSLRAQVRAELEKEYGLDRPGAWKGKVLRGVAFTLLLLVAFAGGSALSPGGFSLDRLTSLGGLFGKGKGQGASTRDVDAMLDTVGPSAGVAGDAAPGTGDADIDDPLIQAAGGKRIGAKGLSIEQAVAAAQAIGGVPGSAGAAGAAAASLPRSEKLRMTADFATELGAMGQAGRAREIVQSVKRAPETASGPALASAAQVADIEVRAWALHRLTEGKARQGVDALRTAAAAIPDAGDRAVALSRAGVVLSRHPQLPPAVAQAFLTLAADAIKTLPESQRRPGVVGEWTVALAEILLADVTGRAKAGQWRQAQAAGQQIDAMAAQVADPRSRARILAVRFQAQTVLGQSAAASQSLEQALALAAAQPSPADQAQWLRTLARESHTASHGLVQAAVATLRPRLESARPVDRAQGLAALSLLHADAGLKAKADPYRVLARETKGLTPVESAEMNARLIVEEAFAEARLLQQAGAYAEAEAVIQRIGNYLL